MATWWWIILYSIINLALVLLISSVGQLRFWIISDAELVLWYRLVMYLAALLWIFSIWFIWLFVCGSQKVDEYSNLGLTMALYACSFTLEEFIFKFLRRNPSDWLALLVIEFMCLSHFRSFCNMTPRYFEDSTFYRIWLCSL